MHNTSELKKHLDSVDLKQQNFPHIVSYITEFKKNCNETRTNSVVRDTVYR